MPRKNLQKIKIQKRERKKKKVRSKIKAISDRPRLSVFRSLKHIYAQIIDDKKGHTLVSASSMEVLKNLKEKKLKKKEIAYEVGKLLAKKAKKIGIKKIVFDRGPYKYHGRVKALAEGARKEGLEF